MKIIFEDEHIVVAEKERGLISQQAEGRANMVDELKKITGSGIFPVHRLDREVGGLMVYAKTAEAAAELSTQVSDRTMEKAYLAVVHGKPETEGRMEDLLFFDKGRNKSFVVKKERRGVKKAALSYELLDSKRDKSLVRITLHTGRTHQIRVQFASRKMPLFGDRRYGAGDEERTIGLWSCHIGFRHPKTKEEMIFEFLPREDEAFRDFYPA